MMITMDLILICKSNAGFVRQLALRRKSKVTFGTDTSADIVVENDPLMDGKHFRVDHMQSGRMWIQDLMSKSGTKVNGRKIQRAELQAGDVVRAGMLNLEVRSGCDVTLPIEVKATSSSIAENSSEVTLDSRPSQSQNLATININAIPTANAGQFECDLISSLEQHDIIVGLELGRGNFGRVYRGVWNAEGGRDIAIKVLDGCPIESPERMKLFLREMSILKQLQHPNIVQFLELGCNQQRLAWFAMEFVDGCSLEEFIGASPNPIALEEVCLLVSQVLMALDYAHRLQASDGPIVHRDLKPSNIMIGQHNGVRTAKLCDFGMAKYFERAGMSGITVTGQSRGNLEYMSPEQAMESKYAGPEVDVYAMGGVFHYCLTRHSLYDVGPNASANEILNAKLSGRFVSIKQFRQDVPEEAQRIVDRAIGRDQARRFRTAGQMLHSIEELLSKLEARRDGE